MPLLALVAGWVVVGFVGALASVLIYLILTGRISLRDLLSEANGQASVSRFQFLVFTFVIAMCVLVLTLEPGEFPRISGEVLLGISGGSFVSSKLIQYNTGPAGGRNRWARPPSRARSRRSPRPPPEGLRLRLATTAGT